MKVALRCPWCKKSRVAETDGKAWVLVACHCRAWAWVTCLPDPYHGRLELWAQVMAIPWDPYDPPSALAIDRDVTFWEQPLGANRTTQAEDRWRVVWAKRRGATGQRRPGAGGRDPG